MSGAISPLSQYTFMAWFSFKKAQEQLLYLSFIFNWSAWLMARFYGELR